MFTQSQYILMAKPLTLDQVAPAFGNFRVLHRHTGHGTAHWAHGTEFWTLAVPGESRGRLMVDVVAHPWPDAYGPNVERAVFAAWSMGQFGPRIKPGSLERAMALNPTLCAAHDIVGHRAFIRLRIAYAPVDGEPQIPSQLDPIEELRFITRVSYFCLELDEVLAYFDPNGEVLAAGRAVWEAVDFDSAMDLIPWHLWAAIKPWDSGWKTDGLTRLAWPEVYIEDLPRDDRGRQTLAAYLNQTAALSKPMGGPWSHGNQSWNGRVGADSESKIITLSKAHERPE